MAMLVGTFIVADKCRIREISESHPGANRMPDHVSAPGENQTLGAPVLSPLLFPH